MTIFMIHGMWATASVRDNYCMFLSNERCDVKTITLLHHSGVPSELMDTGIMDYVEQAKVEIEKLSDAPIIIGHSMGGLITKLGKWWASLSYMERAFTVSAAP